MINIAFFVHSLNVGGIETYLLRFLTKSSDRFNKIYIYCKSGESGVLENKYLKIPNVKIIKHRLGRLNPFSYLKLRSFLKKNNINVVCDFTGNFAGGVIYCAASAGVNNRISFYRSSTDAFKPTFLKNSYRDYLKRLVSDYSTRILSNSSAAFENHYKDRWTKDDRFRIISNGLDTKQFTSVKGNLRSTLGIPESSFVVGHTGRYTEAKNHQVILEVARALVQNDLDIYFILCGTGVKNSLQETVNQSGISHRFFLFNNRNDIPLFLNTMDCYFFPSIREGQPNALIEALLVGLPYVASNIPSIEETVGDKSYLYDPYDATAFADAIRDLYFKNKGKRIRLETKEIAQRFDGEKRFGEFFEVLADNNKDAPTS